MTSMQRNKHAGTPRLFGAFSARLARVAAPVAIALAGLAGCSGTDRVDGMGGLNEADTQKVLAYMSDQLQIAHQIAAMASQDNALEMCFEMCHRAAQSCVLSGKVCDISADHPDNQPLAGRCDVTRERCRSYRTKVPRQCTCDTAAEAAK